jgi:UDP-N-acetylmuramoyl-tripeptide--D-alanyl-D-alanine ligase
MLTATRIPPSWLTMLSWPWAPWRRKPSAVSVPNREQRGEDFTVIGITGSAGKTTTKDLLAGVLSTAGPTVAPQGSYNGEVGVPLTVFAADTDTRFLVIEMGATGLGHIKYLADMVKPDIGVVLVVGTAHAGEFGGVENIAKTKGELVEALSEHGTAVINLDDGRVAAMRSRTKAKVLGFSASPATTEEVEARNVVVNEHGLPGLRSRTARRRPVR